MLTNKIIAHRGESFDAPENTLAAINLAWQRGVSAVEIDIHLTLDNRIVVIHDNDTYRVAGESLMVDLSTAKELRKLNAGAHKGILWKEDKIPFLDEVLKTVPDTGKLIIEVKSGLNILTVLHEELLKSDLRNNQIEIIAFNLKVLALAKQLMPNYKMLWLLDLDYVVSRWLVWKSNKGIINKIKKHNLDGVNLWAGKVLTKKYIKKLKQAGIIVYAWTVDDVDMADYLLNAGVDKVTTNRAKWMIKQLMAN